MKNLPLKIALTVLGTAAVAWMCYWLFMYFINVKQSSIEGAVLFTSFIGFAFEFLVLFIVFCSGFLNSED
jgi:hypothetical protein